MARVKLQLRACPRCGGDLFPERDMDEWELVCLQCGRRATAVPGAFTPRARLPREEAAEVPPVEKVRPAA